MHHACGLDIRSRDSVRGVFAYHLKCMLCFEIINSNLRFRCDNIQFLLSNVNDYDATDNWVRKTSVGFYNVFWIYREIWYKLGFQTINHWGQNTNAETMKWRVKKFYELSGADSGLIDQEQLFNCIESMQVIKKSGTTPINEN